MTRPGWEAAVDAHRAAPAPAGGLGAILERAVAGAMCQEAGQAPHGKRKAERTYRWATDAASGTVVAKSIKHAIRKLIADGEWSTGARERRYIADGSWLRIDGCLVRGGC